MDHLLKNDPLQQGRTPISAYGVKRKPVGGARQAEGGSAELLDELKAQWMRLGLGSLARKGFSFPILSAERGSSGRKWANSSEAGPSWPTAYRWPDADLTGLRFEWIYRCGGGANGVFHDL